MSRLIFEERRFFPECHASCILPLDDGRVLVAYFAGQYEKCDDVGIWLSEYTGSEWMPPRCIAKLCDEPHWNPVLFRMKDGIRIVFKVGREIPFWRSYTMLSRDGGRTWAELHDYGDNVGGGPVRSHPIRLSDGSLLAPNSDENRPWPEGMAHEKPYRWQPRVDISRDDGESFAPLADIPVNYTDPAADDYMAGLGAIQPTLWESAPGHVHALLRTGCGYIFRSDSADGGRTWCRAYNTAMPNNNSGIDVAQAPDGRLFLALNPVSGNFVERTPLCIYVSHDGGDSFKPFAVLADDALDPVKGESAEFSYPSLAVQGDMLYASYTHNRRSIAVWSGKI